jgi:hypothetical protein
MVNKKILYCGVLLIFIIYLFKANDIILAFDNDDKVTKMSFAEILSNTEAYVNVDNCENIGGILEKVYFQGWAFCETLYDNSDKKISLIFKETDGDKCYVIQTMPQSRPDVYGVYRESKDIWNDMTGIECQFSTVKIKEGIYDFYVYVQENEYNYGIYDTQIKYIKDAAGLTMVSE